MNKKLVQWFNFLVVFGVNAIFLLYPVAGLTITDDMGSEIALVKPAQRVISLSPHLTELVFAIDQGEKLVGVMSFSNYPEAAKKIPRIGSHNTISYESIAQIQPDLILAWGSGNGSEAIHKLKSLGFSVYVSEPNKLEGVAATIRKLGILLGVKDKGENEANKFINRLSQLKENYSDRRKISVFYQLSDNPIMTLSGRHLISDVIELCGGFNIFSKAIPIALKVSLESLVRSDPQVIIAGTKKENEEKWLSGWANRASMRAVKDKQVYFIDPDLLVRHGPRIIEGTEKMCNYLERSRKQEKE
ncbi:MAG: cobalamin-binding protein [Porticoccus sp.]|nr:cobalamin-binding protein [Porticoccus sp.]